MALPTGPAKGDLEKAAAENRPHVLKAYRDWWDKAAGLPREKAAEINPLKDAGLRWY